MLLRVLAPAKINLYLRVGSRRSDGFHPLLTWMVTVGLFDSLELERARENGIALRTEPSSFALPHDRRNLVMAAAEELASALSATQEGSASAGVTGLSVVLRKRIPVGAGLGGGSSDAVRTLLALNWLWDANWSLPKLADLSARLGSDLAFFFFGPSSICTGRGEVVRPVAAPKPRAALLVFPEFGISTAQAYQHFDAAGHGFDDAVANEPDWAQWATLPARELLENLVNDLEPAAFAIQPRLQAMRRELQRRLGRTVRMSGSGSTLFTLYDELEEAEQVLARLRRDDESLKAAAVALTPLIDDDLSNGRTTF